MSPKVKKLYKSGKNNQRFLQVLKEADGDSVPEFFASELEKHIFASIYYGWLISEYGIAWELHL